jgi:hypothetical protein
MPERMWFHNKENDSVIQTGEIFILHILTAYSRYFLDIKSINPVIYRASPNLPKNKFSFLTEGVAPEYVHTYPNQID